MNEAETCRQLVRPKLEAAGWDAPPHLYSEQAYFTDGRIVAPVAVRPRRRKRKFADFLLRYTRDVPLAVVEAKSDTRPAGDGLQQAKEYADILGLRFAYATNGTDIVEYDFFTCEEKLLDQFPTPAQLWDRYRANCGLTPATTNAVLIPFNFQPGREPRYYQRIAIQRAVEAVVGGRRRWSLLTLATGTGKTQVAFQTCWKLWSAGWNARGEPGRKPRILFLADRNVLVDDPMAKDFAPFGDARWKIQGEANKGREMYFAIYQAIARDENRPGLYQEYAPDFFDLIVVDECHRGSASDESNWRDILEYFRPAYQLGMTATPLRDDNRDTYAYFGNPLYTYSLKQGIDDGFLAPYRVHRIVTTFDAAGWRPSKGQKDRRGREIPDAEYHTKDFERVVSLAARTDAIARHLTDFLKKTDRHAKTIVFCVDQEHADQMRQALHNLNRDIVAGLSRGEEYVARVTADEGDIGRGFLGKFQDPEEPYPVILTTSQLLTTGVDAPTCQNVVIIREVGSMTEFKQIIGRGTRVRADKGKLFFNILDYTGAATRKFADPDFDGEPALATVEEINEQGEVIAEEQEAEEPAAADDEDAGTPRYGDEPHQPRKYYVHGGPGGIDTEVTFDLDADGGKLRTAEIRQWAGDAVRTLYTQPDDLRRRWSDFEQRSALVADLEERGIDFRVLAAAVGQPDADPFDLLCHLAYDAPLRTCRERAERLRRDKKDFFDRYGPDARAVLNALLDKYADHGPKELAIPDALTVPPISAHGNVSEIARKFGGADKLLEAVQRLQELLYAA
ncbi:MAG TPA: DEAD/DEAH box helicase family protein [Gemmataceae bacterium]